MELTRRAAVAVFLEAATRIDGIDCGGVHLAKERGGQLELMWHRQ